MSDTRHHPPVPGSPQGNDPDAEEAPTGVIGRITGDWPIPDGGLPRREPKPAGDPEAEQGAGGSGGPASERPEHGRHESVLPAPVDESTAAPAHGRHEGGESGPGSAAGPAAEARGGSAPYDKPYEKQPLPTRKPRGAEGPGGIPHSSIPHSSIPNSAPPIGSAPTGSAPAGAASQDRPYEKQPLPVRKPRKPGASRLGMPPASAPQAEGFDYFGRGQERPGVPRAAAASDGPAPPQAFPDLGPRNLSDAFPGAGRRSSGPGHRDGSGLRAGPDVPTPPFG
ncbi:hypothetical protein AB0J39_29300, partial [Microbispora sp. NPDC049633]